MLNIAIVDDENIFVEMLSSAIIEYCDKTDMQYRIDKYNDGYEMLEKCLCYHLVFLDIEMPTINGIEIANEINKLKENFEFPYFVFVTSHDELVFDALKHLPLSYLRKTDINNKESIQSIITKISKIIENGKNTINIRTNRQEISLLVSDVIYIEKKKNYSFIHTNSNEYAVKSPLSFYEELLSGYGFVRSHEGYIVNLQYVYKILDKSILLTNDKEVPISRNKSKMVKETFIKRSIGFD